MGNNNEIQISDYNNFFICTAQRLRVWPSQDQRPGRQGGSKFSKLKIGLTLKQVAALIGPPTSEAQHSTGKMAIPFYFGPDRWVIIQSDKGEGLLTFNYGEEQFLTRIVVK